ncbi:hypothetical protein W97_02398 [Coniosporium apollinis CBS 100218]|uniref:3-hydroxyisobutyrate dehydrogenase n=1 Tax=Coniosporium apollinis (strain CBS 100218) TaxID=1168221 RepID=R7YNG3_CONA1|nr:uncharacterized protein W97_02398 [Coniosporium apollinis CBS 100218]EON63171.1 hypothetical protein W97_02398 [Coniosporium apollinis CBS 100218]
MSSAQKESIGFCGLGAMGQGMATNLLRHGYNVKGFDVYPPSLARFKAAGGIPASSLADSAAGSTYYVCMVATAVQAQSALFDGESAIVPALPRGATLFLCSTVPATYAQSVQADLDRLGRSDILFIDCPVSGGAARAAAGTLSIMAGGSPAALEKGHAILAAMAAETKLYIVEGGAGQGSNMKMVHQVLAGIQILAASEAMGLAARMGLDPRKVRDKVLGSEGWSWMFENRVERMLVEDFYPGVSALTIILKDVGIITQMARVYQYPTPLTSVAEQVYLQGLSQGFGPQDDAGMVRMYYPQPLSQMTATLSGEDEEIQLSKIVRMLAGIHLCAATEAIAFAKHVRLPLGQFYELANDAAGGSAMFRQAGADMIKALEGDEAVLDKPQRYCLGEVVGHMLQVNEEAAKLKCPVYLASAALNLLLLAQQGGRDKCADASVIRLWKQ